MLPGLEGCVSAEEESGRAWVKSAWELRMALPLLEVSLRCWGRADEHRAGRVGVAARARFARFWVWVGPGFT